MRPALRSSSTPATSGIGNVSAVKGRCIGTQLGVSRTKAPTIQNGALSANTTAKKLPAVRSSAEPDMVLRHPSQLSPTFLSERPLIGRGARSAPFAARCVSARRPQPWRSLAHAGLGRGACTSPNGNSMMHLAASHLPRAPPHRAEAVARSLRSKRHAAVVAAEGVRSGAEVRPVDVGVVDRHALRVVQVVLHGRRDAVAAGDDEPGDAPFALWAQAAIVVEVSPLG